MTTEVKPLCGAAAVPVLGQAGPPSALRAAATIPSYDSHLLHQLRRTIGRNIHARRCRRKMPLRKLAALTHIPEYLLDRFELGGGDPSLHHLLRIACALKMDFAQLLV